ncbi:MAG TPA: porin, partial [Alphaproteobacteria bacterium]|nr:porin [Alphaproteobacteria bacterium]
MKKVLLGTTAIVGTSLLMAVPAGAKPTLKIGGAMDFQVGWTSQDREGWSPTPAGVQGPKTERGFDFYHKTLIFFKASDTTDSGMKWAFRVDLNADPDAGPNDGDGGGLSTTGRDNANKATLTLSDAWGSVMVGDDYGPARTWAFGSKTAVKSAGTGGVDGNWNRWFNRTSVSTRFETSTSARDSTNSSKIMYA